MTKAQEIERKIRRLEGELEREREKQLRVEFLSPGTLFSESSSYAVRSRSLGPVLTKMRGVIERHGAKPYGFRFTDGNGKPVSGTHYVTGKVIAFRDVPDDKEHSMLKRNMRCNEQPFAIENNNSYRFTGEFEKDDVVVNRNGRVIERGDSPERMEYRRQFKKECEEYLKGIGV